MTYSNKALRRLILGPFLSLVYWTLQGTKSIISLDSQAIFSWFCRFWVGAC